MFRPAIDGSLEERIEEEMEQAGFDNKSDFVRHACREKLLEVRAVNGGGRP
jgi:Arc/MetJ-type ribon-helix-helix transcriptional regulator